MGLTHTVFIGPYIACTKRKEIHVGNLLYEAGFEDRLFTPEYAGADDKIYLFPNQKITDRDFSFEPRNDSVELDLSSLDPVGDLAAFEIYYKEEIALLKAKDFEFEIKWGLITYSH